MTKMERLKQQARESATLLGHRLGRFRQSVIEMGTPSRSQRPAAVAVCETCGAMVVVDPGPPPGEPEVTGEGVNWKCSAIEQEGHETA